MDNKEEISSEFRELTDKVIEFTGNKGLVSRSHILEKFSISGEERVHNAVKYCVENHLLNPYYSHCSVTTQIKDDNVYYGASFQNRDSHL
ncbi:MAG: hypothetical protein Q7S27_00340 [Nanoarchaeota archaeon]|nr:hypothetical protein [Nanoarchaeota archaeon]